MFNLVPKKEKSKEEVAADEAAKLASERALKKESIKGEFKHLFNNVAEIVSPAFKEGTLTSEDIAELLKIGLDEGSSVMTMAMLSGERIEFDYISIPWHEIDEKTTVDEHVNGRDQAALSRDSVSDIWEEYGEEGNTFPAILNTAVDGKYPVLDGSRRRFTSREKKVPYNAYVPRTTISDKDAKWIATISRLSLALSYRESGFEHVRAMEEQGMSEVKELAIALFGPNYEKKEYERIRQQVRSAQIDVGLLECIPAYNNLGAPLYSKLSTIHNFLEERGIAAKDLVKSVRKDVRDSVMNEGNSLSRRQNTMVSELYEQYQVLKDKGTPKVEAVKTNLVAAARPNQQAQKVTKGMKTEFHFRGHSQSKIQKIEEFVKKVLSEPE